MVYVVVAKTVDTVYTGAVEMTGLEVTLVGDELGMITVENEELVEELVYIATDAVLEAG